MPFFFFFAMAVFEMVMGDRIGLSIFQKSTTCEKSFPLCDHIPNGSHVSSLSTGTGNTGELVYNDTQLNKLNEMPLF